MITPTTEVQIWTFNDTTKRVRLITLSAWSAALKAEVRGYMVTEQPVEPIVREFLGCPDEYPLEEISLHITTSLKSVHEQLGVL